jgi:hypothetical protein
LKSHDIGDHLLQLGDTREEVDRVADGVFACPVLLRLPGLLKEPKECQKELVLQCEALRMMAERTLRFDCTNDRGHNATARTLILRVDKMLGPEGKTLERMEEQVTEAGKLLSRMAA